MKSWKFLLYWAYIESTSEAFLNYFLIHHLFKNANIQQETESSHSTKSKSSPKQEFTIEHFKYEAKSTLPEKLVPILEAEEDSGCNSKEASSNNEESKTKRLEKLQARRVT